MKNLKKIITGALLTIGLITYAQEDAARMDKVNAITAKTNAACENGPKSIAELDDKMKENASLYSEYYKQKDYNMAVKFWRPLFLNAPKYSQNLHLRGANMYKAFAKKAEGEAKELFLDTLFAIHDTRIKCFGSSAKLEKSKAFDYYSYRAKGNHEFVYKQFNLVYDKLKEEGDVNKADPTYLLFWMKATIRVHKYAKAIEEDEVFEKYDIISTICEENMAQDKDAGKYKGAIDAVTEELKKGGYLTAEKIMQMAETKFRANSEDENTIIKAYKAMKACGSECTGTPLFTEIVTKLVEKRPSTGLYKFLASKVSSDGNESLAISYLEKAIDLEDNNDDKVSLYYQIARKKITIGSLSSAREYARKMLALNPNSGPAYMIIASTYAASGKICGTGNDFKSHTVSWAAIDTWRKAISVDSSVKEDAQKQINRYSQYMPSKEELFYEGITVGSSYTISCLGVTTIVRASN